MVATIGGRCAVDRRVVVGHQPLLGPDVVAVGGRPGVQQRDQLGVQRDVPVVVELPDRDPQPIALPDQHHGVGVEITELTGPHSGAGQQLDHQPIARDPVGPSRRASAGGVRRPRTWATDRPAGDVAVEDRVRRGASLQSHSMRRSKKIRIMPQPLALGVLGQVSCHFPGWAAEAHLVVLDLVGCAGTAVKSVSAAIQRASGGSVDVNHVHAAAGRGK